MTNSVKPTPQFKRNLKPLLKKYKTLPETILKLEKDLIKDPFLGESYGHGIYKIRVGDKSKGKGKSGGFRILYYHLKKTENGIQILLFNIFDKSDIETIKKRDAVKEVKEILRDYYEQ